MNGGRYYDWNNAPTWAGGPLDDIQGQVSQVIAGNGPQRSYWPTVAEHAAVGAALGAGVAIAAKRMRQRRAQVGEYTTPLFRGMVIFAVLAIVTLFLSTVANSMTLLVVGLFASFVAYMGYLYRAAQRSRRGGPRRSGRHRTF